MPTAQEPAEPECRCHRVFQTKRSSIAITSDIPPFPRKASPLPMNPGNPADSHSVSRPLPVIPGLVRFIFPLSGKAGHRTIRTGRFFLLYRRQKTNTVAALRPGAFPNSPDTCKAATPRPFPLHSACTAANRALTYRFPATPENAFSPRRKNSGSPCPKVLS